MKLASSLSLSKYVDKPLPTSLGSLDIYHKYVGRFARM
jgi:hypothetical protein